MRTLVATGLALCLLAPAALPAADLDSPNPLAQYGSPTSNAAAIVLDNHKPDWLRIVEHHVYDGRSDDLATAGLGVSGMTDAAPAPHYIDALNPTLAELRRATIFQRGSSGEGFGRIYGPNVDPKTETVIAGDGKIAGDEYLAFDDDGSGRQNVGMLLAVPQTFNVRHPCIFAVPETGSANLYKDVVDFGYWGLYHDCAVVYNDKGLGNGFHDLATDTVTLLNGRRDTATHAGKLSLFTADLSPARRMQFLAAHPDRIAFKHAHSKQNPETNWGTDTLRSIQFAFFALNAKYGRPGAPTPVTRTNTWVIVSGLSNGGGATVYTAEHDVDGWADGYVAAEPQAQIRGDARVSISRGTSEHRVDPARSLVDYFSYAILYQPCAAVATPDAPRRQSITFAENRCTSLREKGLLSAAALPAQGREAIMKLRAYGWEPESDILAASHYDIAPDATAAKYTSDHGRFGAEDRICGLSFAAVDKDGRPIPAPPAFLASIYATAPGGAPTGSIDLVNDLDPTGPRRNALSVSPSTKRQDYNLDGALCLRELAIGTSRNAKRVQAGVNEFLASGDLHGHPLIIVHGRADARVPINFTSRPYLGINSLVEGDASQLRYIELANVQHFPAAEPGYDTRFIRITIYQLRALEAMYVHVTRGVALPQSQVVRALPRGGQPGSAPPLTQLNIPPIEAVPAEPNRITVKQGAVFVPD